MVVKKNIFMLVLFLSFIGSVKLLASNEISKISASDIIAAKKLYDIFKNKEASMKDYEGKKVTVRGIPVKIGPDVYTLPSVELSEIKDGSARLLCVLPFKDYLKLRHTTKGEEAIITGIVRGYSDKYDIVVMKECQIKVD